METETKLKLEVGVSQGRSVLTECYFTSPLKIGTPHLGKDRLTVVLMMASAGILKGDSFDYEIVCGRDTKTRLTEQSYTKIFDTGETGAKRHQHIVVQDHASLFYEPKAVIPFRGSCYDSNILIELSAKSEFVYTDIFAAGRIGMGEQFAFMHYRNRVEVRVDGKIAWFDHCLLEPECMDLTGMLFFDGYTHQGTFYYYGEGEKQEKLLDLLRKKQEEMQENEKKQSLCFGVSNATKGICLRVLADTAQDIEELFEEIMHTYRLAGPI